MPEKSLGSGTYGCGLYPAIVFPDSRVVTEENKYSYVTKVASDAEDEFDKAYSIMSVLKSNGPHYLNIGIFPVEPLHCGISVGDLGKYAEAYMSGKCHKIVGRTINHNVRLYNYRDFQGGDDSWGLDSTDYEDYMHREKSMRYKNSYACGIQYPKFDAVLSDLISKRVAISDPSIYIPLYGNQFLNNLKMMHAFDIFHLDIKPANLCVMGTESKFFDWGFSFIGTTLDDYIAQSRILFDVYENNTFKRGHHWPYYVTLTKRYFNFFDSILALCVDLALKNKTIANYKIIFVFIDSACLLSAVLMLYESYDKAYAVQQHKLATDYLLKLYTN